MFHACHLFYHRHYVVGRHATVIHNVKHQLAVFPGINQVIAVVVDEAQVYYLQSGSRRDVFE